MKLKNCELKNWVGEVYFVICVNARMIKYVDVKVKQKESVLAKV